MIVLAFVAAACGSVDAETRIARCVDYNQDLAERQGAGHRFAESDLEKACSMLHESDGLPEDGHRRVFDVIR